MEMIRAYYGTRKGGSGMRTIADAAEAEKILRGGYGATTVRLVDENGDTVGERGLSEARGYKWFWWFDADAFK